MESVQLSEFYRSVSSWPKTKAEITAIAERIGRLLDVPFVAICTNDDGEKLGFKILGPLASEQVLINEQVLEEFLKRQLRQNPGDTSVAFQSGGYLRQLQLPRENLPWSNVRSAQHLTLAVISSDLKSPGNSNVQRRSEAGWVIVGSSKALSNKEEILLLAAAERLSELVKISILESAIQLRSQFLSIASHELKTPLTSIYGILQLQDRMARLKRDESFEVQEERKASFLKIVIRQVERLNELIDGLLDVSRIQNGRFMVEPSEADVAGLLRDTVNSRLTVIGHEAGVRLNVEAPEHLLSWVDPVRMEEVITNLVMNAIRFSPEGGVVWIKLREEGDSFRMTVRDQGPSVPLDDRERIFQPFERAQRTSRLGGLGLGLFISRQIAQLHGGSVGLVESIPGKGNVFEAHFPMKNVNMISA